MLWLTKSHQKVFKLIPPEQVLYFCNGNRSSDSTHLQSGELGVPLHFCVALPFELRRENGKSFRSLVPWEVLGKNSHAPTPCLVTVGGIYSKGEESARRANTPWKALYPHTQKYVFNQSIKSSFIRIIKNVHKSILWNTIKSIYNQEYAKETIS